MTNETLGSQERGIEAPKSAIVLGVARTMVENTALYMEHVAKQGTELFDVIAHDIATHEFLKRFYELAAPQLPESVIDRRLFAKGDVTETSDVLGAIDAELASWQRGGIVTSQAEPLREFTLWLLDAQRDMANSGLDDNALQQRLERGIDMAEKRLANY